MSQKHVDELNRAAKRIRKGECDYICDALRAYPHPGADGKVRSDHAREIKELIQADMDAGGNPGSSEFSLQSWLVTRGHLNVSTYNSEHNANPKMRKTRLAWIAALIEYWRDKP